MSASRLQNNLATSSLHNDGAPNDAQLQHSIQWISSLNPSETLTLYNLVPSEDLLDNFKQWQQFLSDFSSGVLPASADSENQKSGGNVEETTENAEQNIGEVETKVQDTAPETDPAELGLLRLIEFKKKLLTKSTNSTSRSVLEGNDNSEKTLTSNGDVVNDGQNPVTSEQNDNSGKVVSETAVTTLEHTESMNSKMDVDNDKTDAASTSSSNDSSKSAQRSVNELLRAKLALLKEKSRVVTQQKSTDSVDVPSNGIEAERTKDEEVVTGNTGNTANNGEEGETKDQSAAENTQTASIVPETTNITIDTTGTSAPMSTQHQQISTSTSTTTPVSIFATPPLGTNAIAAPSFGTLTRTEIESDSNSNVGIVATTLPTSISTASQATTVQRTSVPSTSAVSNQQSFGSTSQGQKMERWSLPAKTHLPERILSKVEKHLEKSKAKQQELRQKVISKHTRHQNRHDATNSKRSQRKPSRPTSQQNSPTKYTTSSPVPPQSIPATTASHYVHSPPLAPSSTMQYRQDPSPMQYQQQQQQTVSRPMGTSMYPALIHLAQQLLPPGPTMPTPQSYPSYPPPAPQFYQPPGPSHGPVQVQQPQTVSMQPQSTTGATVSTFYSPYPPVYAPPPPSVLMPPPSYYPYPQ